MLTLNNISVVYDDKIILENVNLEIKKGEIIGIIGPSGAGKSTLLRTMNHMVIPTTGDIVYNNQVLNKNNINKIREEIGMVFQAFELFPHLTVLENIILAPIHLKKFSKPEAIDKAKELLKKVNLLDKINEYPNNLSGGQKQRIAIVRSLIMNPKIMLFDEPTSALDPEMIKEVLNVIKDLSNTGMTICIVTHEINFVKEIATRVLYVDQKSILEAGTTNDVFNNPKYDRLKTFLNKVNY